MKWIIFAAGWYFLGMLCFYQFADWNDSWWVKAYYLWDKGKDLILVGVITYSTLYGEYFKLIFYFCIIRLLWEIAAITISADINNSKVIDWLFMGFISIWIIQMLIEIREWRKLK